jgi:hypothetical protein
VVNLKEKLGNQIFKNSILFFILIYSFELIVRLNVGNKFINWATFRIAISSFLIAIVLGFIITLIHNSKAANIVSTIIAFVLMIYFWIEINLYYLYLVD